MIKKSRPSPTRVQDGALFSEAMRRSLSARLYHLGDQSAEICAELTAAGYGLVTQTSRAAIEACADCDADRARLRTYWIEWAKERLAGLVGPINILSGEYPSTSAYRSEFLADLRDNFIAGNVKSVGPIVSPQFEPTLKQYIERGICETTLHDLEMVQSARRQALSKLRLDEMPEFAEMDDNTRYDFLIARLRAGLEDFGFTIDSHRRTGVIMRKLTSNQQWAFLLVDESRDGVALGRISPSFALTLPKKAVLPSLAWLSAAATFDPSDIVPEFSNACRFNRNSFAEFCLAVDSVVALSRILYRRVDEFLSH